MITLKIENASTSDTSSSSSTSNVTSTGNATSTGSQSNGSSGSDAGGVSPSTPTPALSPTVVPPSFESGDSSLPDEDDEFDGELIDEEGGDDETKTPAAATSGTVRPSSTSLPTTETESETVVSAEQEEGTNFNASPSSEPSSLRGFGFLVLGSGGLVVLATLAFLYKRVFRSKRQQYMNINSQRPQAAMRSTYHDDEEDE